MNLEYELTIFSISNLAFSAVWSPDIEAIPITNNSFSKDSFTIIAAKAIKSAYILLVQISVIKQQERAFEILSSIVSFINE